MLAELPEHKQLVQMQKNYVAKLGEVFAKQSAHFKKPFEGPDAAGGLDADLRRRVFPHQLRSASVAPPSP